MEKVVQATKNIESTVFGRVHELGQRARMAQALSHLLDQMEAGNFRVGGDTKKGSVFFVIELGDTFRELKVDQENSYIIQNYLERVLKGGVTFELRNKINMINEYLEEQLDEEILPGIDLRMLIEEELLVDL